MEAKLKTETEARAELEEELRVQIEGKAQAEAGLREGQEARAKTQLEARSETEKEAANYDEVKVEAEEHGVNLVLLRADGRRKNFALPRGITVVGRGRDCDFRIAVNSVSKRHCQLDYSNGSLRIRDIGSRNGTYINGKPIEEAVIGAGDTVKMGDSVFVVQIDGKPERGTRAEMAV